MPDSIAERLATVDPDAPDTGALDTGAPDELTRVSIHRLVFVMKGLAENDLWDEAQRHLEESGCRDLSISVAPIRLLQEMIRARAGSGAAVGKRAGRFMNSGTCGGQHGGGVGGGGGPKSPGGGGDGGVKAQ
jgi:hypothetical protein